MKNFTQDFPLWYFITFPPRRKIIQFWLERLQVTPSTVSASYRIQEEVKVIFYFTRNVLFCVCLRVSYSKTEKQMFWTRCLLEWCHIHWCFQGHHSLVWGITPTVKLYRSHRICISNLFFTWFYYFWKICIYCKKLCDWTSNTSLIMFTSNSYSLVFLNTKISKDNFLSTILKQMFKYVSKFKVKCSQMLHSLPSSLWWAQGKTDSVKDLNNFGWVIIFIIIMCYSVIWVEIKGTKPTSIDFHPRRWWKSRRQRKEKLKEVNTVIKAFEFPGGAKLRFKLGLEQGSSTMALVTFWAGWFFARGILPWTL